MKTFVMIPTWNESQNIELLINEILKLKISKLEIVVVDDNSPDGTWKVVEKLSKKNKKIHLLLRKENKGRGHAGIAGFQYALEHGADCVIEMDADFSHQPKHIPEMLKQIKNYDVIIGSRFVKGGYDIDRKAARQLSTILSNRYAAIMLGVKLKDPNSGYRCYTKNTLEKINVNTLKAKGPDIVQEIIYRCKQNNLKIKEIPIEFKDRTRGQTTKTAKDFITGAITSLKLRFGAF